MTNTLFIVPSLSRAGAETQVVSLVNGLANEDFRKFVFCFEPNIDQRSRLEQNIPFYHVPRRYKFDIRPIFAAARLINELHIEIVHCTLEISLLFGWLGARLAKRKPKLVAAIHTTVNVSRKGDFFNLYLFRWLLRNCKAVIFVCEAQKSYWQKRFPFLEQTSHVIHNGVDVDHFCREQWAEHAIQQRRSLGIPREATVICHVAAFRPEKGHGILLEAFDRVRRQVDNVYLIFAGDGPLRPSVEKHAANKGLISSVRFIGNVPDIRPVLAASDLTVLASTAVETFSMAMLESLAMEVPMVATNMGGTAEAVISGNTGLIVPPGDVASLALALADLAGKPLRRAEMGRAGRQLVVERFTKKGMIAKTRDVLQKAALA
jgi:glycosyltransferase involved in cell wall biosynthesis